MAKEKKNGKNKKGLFLKITEYVDPLYLKVMIGTVIFMCMIAVSLIIINGMKERKQAIQEYQEMMAFQEGLNKAFSLLTINDFIFPEQYGRASNQIYLQREPKSFWTEEEIERNWISIEDTGLKDLTEQNKQLILELLEGSP